MTQSAMPAIDFDALATGRHNDPFAVLGPHRSRGKLVVRTFQPQAKLVELTDRDGTPMRRMRKVHGDGIFSATLPDAENGYLLRITDHDGRSVLADDPYRFPSPLGELDLYLMGEGTHRDLNRKLGAHVMCIDGVTGTHFAVWAPNASRVSVIGEFNQWDGRRHVMRLHRGNGIWDIFIPGISSGTLYKYEILDAAGKRLPLKTDPMAHYYEPSPGNAARVFQSSYEWRDATWMARRSSVPNLDAPMSIYEVHPGSWRRRPEQGDRFLSYRELADELVGYVRDNGFTHIELMPISEYPFDGSWGYQPIGLFAPTQRFGDPDDFRYFVDACHRAGLALIIDWVPAHFPRDEYGLAQFDGTALYEHADPRLGEHADWGTLIYNYGRREVCNYLIANACYWIEEFHIDGLRVDAVASMLYLDYSRADGEWLPNEHGGNENLEAVAFLKRLNEAVHASGGITLAEESTAWPAVSRPTWDGGLGFTYKWNMGWMNDTLSYVAEDPVHRRYHHDKLTFGLIYAFNENFILPLSHDEVVHGKRSILGRMPGDEWQRFANLRAYYGFMFGHPGKKLMFMGNEFAQYDEWAYDQSLDWHLLEFPPHQGVHNLVAELNSVYQRYAALHQVDFETAGFEWIDWNDRENSILSWLRRGREGETVICLSNFTPVVRQDYHLGVPCSGCYEIILNTDEHRFGGSGVELPHKITSIAQPAHGRDQSLRMTIPPLATLMLNLV